jgi:hypothetical protein
LCKILQTPLPNKVLTAAAPKQRVRIQPPQRMPSDRVLRARKANRYTQST